MFDWFGKGKDSKGKDDKAVVDQPVSPPAPPSIASTSKPPLSQQGSAQQDTPGLLVGSTAPKPSSVFEFGPQIQVGADMMRGVCTGDDPDAIQACTWSIEPLQGKPKEKKHSYRIEF
jgi:hypothetical protein